MANWPGRRSLSLPWPIKHEHESLRAPFPRLCTLHLPLVSACTAARETRRRAIAGHPALPDAGEQSLGILASSLASRSAAQEPDTWSPSFPAEPSRRCLLPSTAGIDLPHRHFFDAVPSPEASLGGEHRASPFLCVF
jgi:hypothetical protein